MKAVWSFWSKPFQAHHHWAWASEKHHLLAWVLSVETAKQHYPDTWLITDDAGARLLVDGIGLQFARVSTELNALDQLDPDWWGMGKIYAYRIQREPFVHIDNDVFLWKRLPARLEHAAVFAQCPEPFANFAHYQPEQLEQSLRQGHECWLPAEWHWYRHNRNRRGVCCGILGGNHVALINQYADASFRLVSDPHNQKALQALPNKYMHMLTVEQYMLVAFVEYRKARATLPSSNIDIECLFGSMADAWNPRYAVQTGFTHLAGGAKMNPRFTERLENRVRQDYPKLYERCIQYLGA